MTECDEIAANTANHLVTSKPTTFDGWLALVAGQMPGEDPAGTIVNNVAWALYRLPVSTNRQGDGDRHQDQS